MKYNFLYVIFALLAFTACNKEKFTLNSIHSADSFQALVIGGDEDGKKEEDKGKKDCFKLIYPLSITLPDGVVISGEEKALWENVKNWYEANSEVKEKPELNYPIDVFWLADGEIKTIDNEEDMEVAKKYCDEDKEWKKDCFALVYPLNWTMPDGTMITMNDSKDLEATKNWYELNPDEEGKPNLNYPVDIVFEDGSTQMINNEEEMEIAKVDCE